MKAVKILGALFGVYVLIVIGFESLLGYFQPESERTIVIHTFDEDGEHRRIVSRLEHEGVMYVAVNHWPRAWFWRLEENPGVKVTEGDKTVDHTAQIATGADHDKMAGVFNVPIGFRILTGFPPRYFIKLVPTAGEQTEQSS